MKRLTLLPVPVIAALVFLPACQETPYTPGHSGTGPMGSLQVTTVTTGEAFDDDGYTASLNCGCFEDIGVDESVTLPDIDPGQHMVLLTGIANNCEVSDPNPRWVDVVASETARTTFSIVCRG